MSPLKGVSGDRDDAEKGSKVSECRRSSAHICYKWWIWHPAGEGIQTSCTACSSSRWQFTLARKRKAVSYKEQGGGDDDGKDGDADGGVSKKSKYAMGNKEYGEDGVLGGMGKWCNRQFPSLRAKGESYRV